VTDQQGQRGRLAPASGRVAAYEVRRRATAAHRREP
jgi:hypothetical protein